MTGQKVELVCETCSSKFEVLTRNYEKYVHGDDPVYCDDCFSELMRQQQIAELPKRKQFEYISVSMNHDLNQAGRKGWELVQILNDIAYFKREYIEGVN